MADRVTIYRCVTCGKWSHAKRKPAFHLVCSPDVEMESSDPRYVKTEFVGFGFEEGPSTYTTYRCGPFESWTAKRRSS